MEKGRDTALVRIRGVFWRPVTQATLLLIVVTLNLVVWTAVFFTPQKTLKVSFLNVGQGDAIFIEGPTGIQVLVDGGKDRSVLRELGKHMGPLDRSIDLVIETHPDADHIGGLPGVFETYEVKAFMQPGIPNNTNPTQALETALIEEGILEPMLARRGMRLLLGGGAYADILYPDREVSSLEPNTGSVIMRVVYGENEFFLSGDAPEAVENWVVRLGGALQSDVLKAGHHGSKTSTGEQVLQATEPEVVIVSAGKDNQYGHPHAEAVTRIQNAGAVLLSTAEEGTISFVSNGTVIQER